MNPQESCDQDADDPQAVSKTEEIKGVISKSILLVNDEYGTIQGGVSTINRLLGQFLASLQLNVYCIVLTATDKDKEDAERDHVTLLFPKCHDDDKRKPCLPWLFDHATRFPHLPSDISCVIGYRDVTSDAAVIIKEERYPHAKLFLFNHDMPEDTDHYKDESEVLEIQRKKETALKDAEKADALFSVGPYMHDYYCNMYRALEDPSKPHIKFVPKPSDVFIGTNPTYIETQTKVVLSIGKVSGVERLKGYDLAAMALNMVAETFPHMKWQQRGISRDAFYESKKIIDSRIDLGTFHFTPLEHGTQEQICKDIKQAHLVLVPSRSEPFGLIGLEAIAAGIPVLLSDRSGLAVFLRTLGPEFDHCIFHIQGNDAEDSKNLAKKITEMLQNGSKEFEFSRQLKDKLLTSKYWEESQRALCQECGVHMEAGVAGTISQQKAGITVSMSHPNGDISNGHLTPSSLVQKPTHSYPGPSRPLLKASSDQQISMQTTQTCNNGPNMSPASPSELLNMNIGAAMEIVVASIISDEWRTLLRHLGLTEQELETLQNKETPEAACEAGLKLWRETRGQEVTIERLVKAVRDTKVKLRNGADVKVKLSIKEKWSDWLNKKADIIFTEEVLNDQERFGSAMLRFKELKGSIKDLWEGSVWCLLTFHRWSSVQEFVDGCREGALTELLTQEYVDEQMIAASGGTELYVCVEIDQTDLHKAWNFFHANCHSPDEDHPPSDDCQAAPLSALSSIPLEGEPMDIDTHITVKEEPMDFESDLDTVFEIVCKDLWSDWERLARSMGFTQSDMDSIRAGSPDQPYEQCWRLLYRWRDREGQKATLQVLMQQLRVAGFHDTAEKLGIGDMSDQDKLGASKKTSDDSEASSDSDSDSDGDDDSMKGTVTAPPSKMKPLKTGKRRVPDPQQTSGKGVKMKKMEEDDDVEMVEQTGVSTRDNTVQAEVSTDDLCFMLTPADIKRCQEAMKTHVVPERIASLEEQFRSNMLVMHLIKDEFFHEHLCHYWNDKGSLPVRLTQFVSYVVTKLGHEYCIKGNLDVEAYNSMEEDIQYQFGKLLFKLHAGGVHKLLSLESLQSCFTYDQLKYVQAWLEPTSSDTGPSSLASYYRFRHECLRQYMMAIWVAGTIREAGETIRANEFLRQCFDLSSKLDLMAYFVAGLMAQKNQVDLFSYQLSRILFSMDTTDFCVSQKVAICMAETGQVDRFESHTSQIFPGNVIDLTSWPSMSYLGKLALAHLKETFQLTCDISHEVESLNFLFKSKKNKAEAQSLLSLIKSRHRSVFLYPHYKSLLDSSSALVSQTPCRIEKLYFNNLALNDLSSILSLLQFVPALKHLSLLKTMATLSPSGMSQICDFLSFIPNIEHLVLSKCRISNDSFSTLGEHFQCLQKLKHLNLSQTGITSEGANIVAHHLSSLKELEVVDLRKNKVGKDELTNLCNAIANADKIPQLFLGSRSSFYKILLGISNSRGGRLIVKTSDTDVVTLHVVSQLSSQIYRVELSHQGKVLYSVQTAEGENPHRMTLDLTCAGDITENIRALAAALPVGHSVQQADVEELKLGRSCIGDEGGKLLAEMFCYLPRLKHLELSYNQITSTGAVAAHLSHLQQLEWLDLCGNDIGEDGVSAMYEKLAQLEKLIYLNLSINGVSVDMRKSLLFTLSKMEHLSEVNLSTEMSSYVYLLGVYNNKGNRLTINTADTEVVLLVNQVFSQVYRVELSCQGKVLYSVQTEDENKSHWLTFSDLTCAGTTTIAKSIDSLAIALPTGHRVQHTDVEKLDLRINIHKRNGLSDHQAEALSKAFPYFHHVKHLDLNGELYMQRPCNQHIQHTSCISLVSQMSHLKNLEWLRFTGNPVCNDGAEALANSFLHMQHLSYLDLSSCKITASGAKVLAEHFLYIQSLKYLNLSLNKIGTTGVTAVAAHILKLKQIEQVYLHFVALPASSITVFVEAYTFLHALKRLGLRGIISSADSLDDTGEDIRQFVNTVKGKVYKERDGEVIYDGGLSVSDKDKLSQDRMDRQWSTAKQLLDLGAAVDIKTSCLTVEVSVSIL